MSPPLIGMTGFNLNNLSSGFAGSDVSAEESVALSESSGNSRAAIFALLVDRHSRLMFRVAYSLLRNAQDAEDAVQEALLKLYRGDAWRRMEDEMAFLARTVWRAALDRLPKLKEQPLESAAEPSTKESDSPEASVARDSRAALLRRMIAALPDDLRRVLLLSAIQELNSREISEVLGIPEGTVRTRLMRAKDELRRRYEASAGRAR